MVGRTIVGGLVLAASCAAGAVAQDNWRVVPGDGWCNDREGGRDGERYCEVRATTLRSSGTLAVDAAPNGGIQVTAGDVSEIRLEAKVMAVASSTAEARALASEVHVRTSGTISATGPNARPREWWTVSYRLTVPARTDLDLRSHNGGISLTGVRGHTEFTTMNGGVKVSDAGGSMRGRTTNGGVKVALTGAQWDGEGLDLSTTNGGVTLEVPADYNAHLETGTVNGGISLDFPVRVQGRLDRQLSTDLGSGGPTIRAVTTNGGVSVRRR
jgi:hypothetical protein